MSGPRSTGLPTLRDRPSWVLLVGGDAGVGKSTLVAEARRAGADLFVGRSVPIGGEVIPLSPLVELVRNVRRSSPKALNARLKP